MSLVYHMSTFRGLIKNEVYNNIVNCIKDGRYDNGLEYFVDLACTKGELINLINFLINYYGKYILTSSPSYVTSFTNKLERLEKIPRKGMTDNPIFQNSVIQLYCMLCIKRQNSHNMFDSIKENVFTIKQTLLSVTFEYDYIDKDFRSIVDGYPLDVKQKMTALITLLKNKDKKLAIGLVYVLITNTSTNQLESVNLNCFKYNKIHKIKHIGFYIWRIIYAYSKKYKPYLLYIIDDYYTIYSIGLTKKNIMERANILLFVIYILASEKSIKTDDDIETKINSMSNKLKSTNIFNKVLNKVEPNKSEPIKEIERVEESDEKHDYLKCITFIK